MKWSFVSEKMWEICLDPARRFLGVGITAVCDLEEGGIRRQRAWRILLPQ
jgi:hypothetical protein